MNIQTQIRLGYAFAKKVLKISNVGFSENNRKKVTFSTSDLSDEFWSIMQDSDYLKIYETARANYDYNLLLDDGSIFQFTHSVSATGSLLTVRYAYYESPQKFETYEDFLLRNGLDIMETGGHFYDYYLDGRTEISSAAPVTPIRYDYDRNLYTGIKHCISHLHIGHCNEVRIPVSLIMSPGAFVGFVVRHVYYGQWKDIIDDHDYLSKYIPLKRYCVSLAESDFSSTERKDLHIV